MTITLRGRIHSKPKIGKGKILLPIKIFGQRTVIDINIPDNDYRYLRDNMCLSLGRLLEFECEKIDGLYNSSNITMLPNS